MLNFLKVMALGLFYAIALNVAIYVTGLIMYSLILPLCMWLWGIYFDVVHTIFYAIF